MDTLTIFNPNDIISVELSLAHQASHPDARIGADITEYVSWQGKTDLEDVGYIIDPTRTSSRLSSKAKRAFFTPSLAEHLRGETSWTLRSFHVRDNGVDLTFQYTKQGRVRQITIQLSRFQRLTMGFYVPRTASLADVSYGLNWQQSLVWDEAKQQKVLKFQRLLYQEADGIKQGISHTSYTDDPGCLDDR